MLKFICYILLITTCMSSQNDFSSILTLTKTSISSGEKVELLFSVKNISDSNAQFCDYHTPFEGIRNDILQVKGPRGKELKYKGILAKRVKPGKNNYHNLTAGKSKSVSFEIDNSYDLSQKGRYQISFTGNESINGLPDSNTVLLDVH